MKNQFVITGIIILIINTVSFSQEKITVEEYISQYKSLAIDEMKKYHIPASITLAQGILESESGNSQLAVKANNHFGIKCHKGWTGKTFYQDDDVKDECFRKYNKPGESYRDHSEFLSTRDRYNFLFDLDISDYKGWAYGLKQAGYATNPRYPELLIRIIEENGLDKYRPGQRSAVSGQQSKLRTQHSELPEPRTFEMAGRAGNDRVIFLNNGVKFILAREGDDFYKLEAELQIYSRQLFEYNEMSKKDKLKAGEKVYLEKKKGKAKNEIHIVRQGETLWSVSQDYGIRLKAICRLNSRKPGDNLSAGERLKLK